MTKKLRWGIVSVAKSTCRSRWDDKGMLDRLLLEADHFRKRSPRQAMDGVPLAERPEQLKCGVAAVDLRSGQITIQTTFRAPFSKGPLKYGLPKS